MSRGGKNWGGKRKGAGRPAAPTVTKAIKLPREVWALIEAEAARRGTTPEEEAARVLREHWAAQLFATMD